MGNDYQVSRVGDTEDEGAFSAGDLIIHPPGVPSFYAWEPADESIHIALEPELLRRVAAEACETNPDRIELLPRIRFRDAQIERIALLFNC